MKDSKLSTGAEEAPIFYGCRVDMYLFKAAFEVGNKPLSKSLHLLEAGCSSQGFS
jgi:hypothetical protein